MLKQLLRLPPDLLQYILAFVGDDVVIINNKPYVFVNCKNK